MKCISCGAEIKSEFNICPYCGNPIQIVPDYSIYDDDDINVLLEGTKDVQSKNNKAYKRAEKERQKKLALEREKRAKEKKTKKTLLIVGVSCAVLVFLGIIGSIIINLNNQNSYDYQMKQADGAMFKQNYEEAEEFYLKALELEPEDVRVRLDLAKLYIKRENPKEAIKYLTDILEIDPLNYDAYKTLYQVLVDLNDVDAILELKNTVSDSNILKLFDDYSVDAPKFSVEAGTYSNDIKLALSANKGEEIYYTVDGSDPIEDGEKYVEEILLEEGTHTVKVVSKNDLGVYSDVASQTYIVKYEAPESPIVTPDGGTFTSANNVYISVPEGCSAYYTWDRTEPTANSSLYVSPISIPEGYNILSVIIIDNETGMKSSIYKGAFEYVIE